MSLYSCCNGDAHSDGCQVHPVHISDVMELRGFVTTQDPDDDDDEPTRVSQVASLGFTLMTLESVQHRLR